MGPLVFLLLDSMAVDSKWIRMRCRAESLEPNCFRLVVRFRGARVGVIGSRPRDVVEGRRYIYRCTPHLPPTLLRTLRLKRQLCRQWSPSARDISVSFFRSFLSISCHSFPELRLTDTRLHRYGCHPVAGCSCSLVSRSERPRVVSAAPAMR